MFHIFPLVRTIIDDMQIVNKKKIRIETIENNL